MKPFRSFSNIELVNQPDRPVTRDEMAADLAEETCERYKALRAEAMTAEQNAELPLAWNPQAQECIDTLEALMKGRHGWIVKPIILEHFPEFARPVTEDEKRVVERYLADKAAEAVKSN